MLTHKETSPVRLLHVVGDSRFGGAASIILGLGQLPKRRGGKSTFSPPTRCSSKPSGSMAWAW